MTNNPVRYQRPAWRVINRVVNIVAVSAILLFALVVIGFCWVLFSPAPPLAEIPISESDNTRLEVYKHWTGGFSGWQHDEYLVYYVRSGGWIGSDQKKLLPSGQTAGSGDVVKFRRIDATTIELIKVNSLISKDTTVLGRYFGSAYSI